MVDLSHCVLDRTDSLLDLATLNDICASEHGSNLGIDDMVEIIWIFVVPTLLMIWLEDYALADRDSGSESR